MLTLFFVNIAVSFFTPRGSWTAALCDTLVLGCHRVLNVLQPPAAANLDVSGTGVDVYEFEVQIEGGAGGAAVVDHTDEGDYDFSTVAEYASHER
jgi:hypothetical protein|eukprot:COSAG01_NODE_33584_length_561_cov_83.655844_1_plen_95_part_00